MISKEFIVSYARKNQTSDYPNIVREYFQHLFLSEFYRQPEADKVQFKGGTALRIIYGSPRFSEDLDFSISADVKHAIGSFVEEKFIAVLSGIQQGGSAVALQEAEQTSGGYFGSATFQMYDYPPVTVEINVSSRSLDLPKAEVDSIDSDLVPTYPLFHLQKESIVEEKIFQALVQRKKERDFYDLYYLLRKGMVTADQKKRLTLLKDDIIRWSEEKNFQGTLKNLLPANYQPLLNDFHRALRDELERT